MSCNARFILSLVRSLVSLGSLAVALAISGCVDPNFGAFYIKQAMMPEPGCVQPKATTGSSSGTAVVLGNGLLDLSLRPAKGYLLYVQVENHMTQNTAAGQVETNAVLLREYKVQLKLGNLPGSYPETLTKFSEGSAGVIVPNEQWVSSLHPIPDALAPLLAANVPGGTFRASITADIRAVGDRSGSTMESPAFPFPITLCNGCLVDMRKTCPTSSTETFYANVCGLPQDAPVTCCPTAEGGINCMVKGSAVVTPPGDTSVTHDSSVKRDASVADRSPSG